MYSSMTTVNSSSRHGLCFQPPGGHTLHHLGQAVGEQGAGGLVLRRLSAHACDADWAKAFVDRSAASELLRNAAALEGCGVYFSAGAAAPCGTRLWAPRRPCG